MKPTLFNLEVQTKEVDGDTVAEIDVDGVIGYDFWSEDPEKNTKERMREQLREIDGIEADKIIVNISSLGGDVDHGLAIHDLLANNSAEVETRVIGMTASAATIIAQAGDTRTMSDNSLYLVHRAWTIAMGNANDFEAMAKDLEKLDGRISNIYSKRSEKSQDEFMELMNESNGDGIWISAEEAEEYGLIDSITEPMKAAAMPKDAFEKYNIPTPPQMKDQKPPKMSVNVTVDADDIMKAINKTKEQESTDVENVSAPSREREKAKLELLKTKSNLL